ncbi:MAG: 4-hydroxybenzoate octaprenyltransferase, partial [Euryarchaeota archaeon]|nr:4-hydroxybenzoate octaprenyltransferase [Euryarchaeota archaeon]
NRLIDRDIDARNPRTKDRALPAGLVSPGEVKVLVAVSLIILFICALMLNRLCVALYPFAVALFVIYPYLKRFTWLAHIPLGMTLGIAPLGAWVAVRASFDIAPWLLFLAVTFWVAGFDVIYAIQDLEFDTREGLHSIPARFGVERALRISAGFHLLTLISLALLVPLSRLGGVFALGVAVTAVLLVYEHSLVSPSNLERAGTAFFNVNVAVGFLTFLAVAADVFL